MSESPTPAGLAAWVQLFSPEQFHRWEKGGLLFVGSGEDHASFPGHSQWPPSCFLPQVLSENNQPQIHCWVRPLGRSGVLLTGPSCKHRSGRTSQAGGVTKHSFFCLGQCGLSAPPLLQSSYTELCPSCNLAILGKITWHWTCKPEVKMWPE